uniref:DPPIV_N domain-containing protein n=1 Tax=Strongyloides papillosus TaxID=174720 RepID=A0A0N5BAR2_STREA
MNRKIYVFEKDKPPYVVYSEKNSNVTSYVFDSVTNTILISALEPEDEYDGREYIKLQFKLRGLGKTYICENSGSRNEVYTSYSLLNFQDNNYFNYHLTSRLNHHQLPQKDTRILSFIPGTGNDTLRVYVVNNCSNELLMEEKIRNLHSCIGVTALDTLEFVNSKMIRIPIVVILDDDFVVYNFYSSIE